MEYKKIDAKCTKCGWTFTVHEVPETPEYKKAKWFCPHCSHTAKAIKRPAPLLVLHVEGGLVQSVYSNEAQLVEIYDLDNEDEDTDKKRRQLERRIKNLKEIA